MAQASRPHVSFKCGRMNFDPNTGQVTPDPRKGVLQVVTAEDSLTHLQWRTRRGEVEQDHDLIVFPGETEMKRYGDESADTANIERLNAVLQNGPHQIPVPPQALRIPDENPVTQVPSSAPPAMALQSSSATAVPPAAGADGKGKITMESVSRMLDGIGGKNNAPTVGELLRRSEMAEAAKSCTSEELSAVYEKLPEIERNPESVVELLRNEAVLLQALELTRALHEAPPAEILPSLGLPVPDDVNTLGLPALIDSVKKAVRQEREEQQHQ